VELLAERLNDDNLTRYRFTKESVICGLQTGLGYPAFIQLMQWLNFDSSSRQVLEEWASCYQLSSFLDVLILRMNDTQRFNELRAMPQFRELTSEVIPNFGFIIPRKNKDLIRDFLKQFGLYPGASEIKITDTRPVEVEENYKDSISSVLTYGRVDYSLDEKAHVGTIHELSLHGQLSSPVHKLSLHGQLSSSLEEKTRIIEDAIATEKNVEMSFMENDRKRILVRPLHLVKDNESVKIIATEIQSGHRNQYVLADVTSLRVSD